MKKKSVNVKKVWAVYSTRNEYGSYDVVDDLAGVYEDKTAAEKAADGIGWYGGRGGVHEMTAVKSDGTWWLSIMPFGVKINKKHVDPKSAIREKALSKLTKEEKAELNLED